jgi:hypothetical protein
MITQTMVQPSSWIEAGIKLQKTRGLNLFKFTDDLQMRLETLIDRQKANLLTPEENAELAGITKKSLGKSAVILAINCRPFVHLMN